MTPRHPRDAQLVDVRRLHSWFDERSDIIWVWSVDGGYVAEMDGIGIWHETQNGAGSMAYTCWLAQ